jgi:hypothetical protein
LPAERLSPYPGASGRRAKTNLVIGLTPCPIPEVQAALAQEIGVWPYPRPETAISLNGRNGPG